MCKEAKADLAFLVDGSWSIGDDNFLKITRFLYSTMGSLDLIGPDGTQVSRIWSIWSRRSHCSALLGCEEEQYGLHTGLELLDHSSTLLCGFWMSHSRMFRRFTTMSLEEFRGLWVWVPELLPQANWSLINNWSESCVCILVIQTRFKSGLTWIQLLRKRVSD